MTPITKDNSILNSYKRIGGGTPVINTSNQTGRISGATPTIKVSKDIGPQFKSETEFALERYEAEKAVQDQMQKDAEAKNPMLRVMREQSELQQSSIADQWNKTKQRELEMRNRFSRENPGNQDYQKWRNYQEIKSGTPAGQFLMRQRLAQLGGDVNSAEYKDLSLRARNAALAT